MNVDASLSGSASATSGIKTAIGPVTFAPVNVSQGGNKQTTWLLIIAGVILAALFLFRK